MLKKPIKHYVSSVARFPLPRASTIGSFFTIAFFLAILITPRANVTVTTIGRPSGIAATARLQNNNKRNYKTHVGALKVNNCPI